MEKSTGLKIQNRTVSGVLASRKMGLISKFLNFNRGKGYGVWSMVSEKSTMDGALSPSPCRRGTSSWSAVCLRWCAIQDENSEPTKDRHLDLHDNQQPTNCLKPQEFLLVFMRTIFRVLTTTTTTRQLQDNYKTTNRKRI